MSGPPDIKPPDFGGNAGKAPPDTPDTTIAAFGDSLMWGQGVARDKRFSFLTAQGIRKLVPNPTDGPMIDRSRSGANIEVRVGSGSGRKEFADTYPSLLPTDTDKQAFLNGDESAARKLFGEVPCTFPTVTWQVESLSDSVGSKIQFALLSGGANDINFEAILDPRANKDKFVGKFEGDINEICYVDTLDLLEKARLKMPNAVILLFGYYPPFSYETDLGELKDYFKHELDSEVKWFLNGVANFLDISGFGTIDIDEAVVEARVRSVWAQGLATYYLRKAVTDANRDDAIRGPGVVFVPCGFGPINSAFTPQSMVWEDYDDPASDSMQAERVKEIPRFDARHDLVNMIVQLLHPGDDHEAAQALRDKIDGPESLKEALLTRASVDGISRVELLAREIHRIQRALIASFLHPNTQGDRKIANMAVGRYDAHRLAIDDLPGPLDPPPLPGGPESLEDRLSRFGLRGQGPLRADVGHEFVDAIRVTVDTSGNSDKDFGLDLYLLLFLMKANLSRETVKLQLNMQYYDKVTSVKKFHRQLEPSQTDEFSIDVSGSPLLGNVFPPARGVLLKELVGMNLVVGDLPPVIGQKGKTWLPEDLTVDINGVQVLTRDLRGKRLGPGDRVDLEYPAPVQVQTPKLASTMVRIGTVPQ